MSDPEISSGSGSDAEQEDAINQKVARVIQPLVKKLRRQAKRIDGLEAALALAETETKERIPALERSVAELRSELSERASKLQADVGDRASLADLARIEMGQREAGAGSAATIEEVRGKTAAAELMLRGLQSRLEGQEGSARAAEAALDSRLRALSDALEHASSTADARRSDMELRVGEVSAKAQGERAAMKSQIEAQLRQLDADVRASARRADVDSSLGGLTQSIDMLTARFGRHEASLGALQQEQSELRDVAEGDAVADRNAAERHRANSPHGRRRGVVRRVAARSRIVGGGGGGARGAMGAAAAWVRACGGAYAARARADGREPRIARRSRRGACARVGDCSFERGDRGACVAVLRTVGARRVGGAVWRDDGAE